MSYPQVIELFSILLGIVSILGGGLAWYGASVKKAYAAERQFVHIQNSINQLSANVDGLAGELEDYTRTAIEVKALVLSISNRLEGIAARIDSTTGGWVQRP